MGQGGSPLINDKPTKDDPFGGYKFAIRTFWFDVTELNLYRNWIRNSFITDESEFSSAVNGKATSRDLVKVIGRDDTVRQFDFALRADTDAKQSWEFHKKHDVLTYTDLSAYHPEHIRIKRLITECLDANPPTAVLLIYDDDWESGIEKGNSIECKVPPEVFSKIESEIAAKTIHTISIGVRWEAGLVWDEHAPPNRPTFWGMFCLSNGRAPEPLRGHVASIRWSPTTSQQTTAEDSENRVSVATPAPVKPVPGAVMNMPNSAIAALWLLALAAVFHLFK